MSYYQGDFYAGDPSFWGSIGGFFKGAARSLIPGIPVVGPIASKIPGLGGGTGIVRAIRGTAAPSAAGLATRAGGLLKGTVQTMVRHPVLSAAGAAGVVGAFSGGMAAGRTGMVPAGQRGFHISRRTGQLVRNRRMRVTNPKALRRAIRRTTGFAKLAMRTIHIIHPKKRGRFGGFKKRRSK